MKKQLLLRSVLRRIIKEELSRKKRLMKENRLLTEELFPKTPEGNQDAISKIKHNLEGKVPYYVVNTGPMSRNDSIYLVVGFQEKGTWPSGIMENSNYFRMRIELDGTMEVFTQSLYKQGNRPSFENRLPVKFRKARAKDLNDAIKKLNAYISLVQSYYE